MSNQSSGDPGDLSHPHGIPTSKLNAKQSKPFTPFAATSFSPASRHASTVSSTGQNGCSPQVSLTSNSTSATPFYPTNATDAFNTHLVPDSISTASFPAVSTANKVLPDISSTLYQSNRSGNLSSPQNTSNTVPNQLPNQNKKHQNRQENQRNDIYPSSAAQIAQMIPFSDKKTIQNVDNKAPKVCPYFNSKKGCSRGELCPWLHVTTDFSSKSTSVSTKSSTIVSKNDAIETGQLNSDPKRSMPMPSSTSSPRDQKNSNPRLKKQNAGQVTPTTILLRENCLEDEDDTNTSSGTVLRTRTHSRVNTNTSVTPNQKIIPNTSSTMKATSTSSTSDHLSLLLSKQTQRLQDRASTASTGDQNLFNTGGTVHVNTNREKNNAKARIEQNNQGASNNQRSTQTTNSVNITSSTTQGTNHSTNSRGNSHNKKNPIAATINSDVETSDSEVDLDFTSIDLEDIDESSYNITKSSPDTNDVMKKLFNPTPSFVPHAINQDDDLYGNKYNSSSSSQPSLDANISQPMTSNRLQHIVHELINNDYHCLICMDAITEHTYVHNCNHCNVIFHFDCMKAIAVGDTDTETFKKAQKSLALQRRHGKGYKTGIDDSGQATADEFNNRAGAARSSSAITSAGDKSSLTSAQRHKDREELANRQLDDDYLSFSKEMNKDGYNLQVKKKQFENQRIFDDNVEDVDIDRYFNKFQGSSGGRSYMHEFITDCTLGGKNAMNKSSANLMKLTKAYNCPSCSTLSTSFNLLPLCFCGHNHDTIYKTISADTIGTNDAHHKKNAKQKKTQLLHNNIMPHSCGQPCDRLLSDSAHYYATSNPSSSHSSTSAAKKILNADLLPLFYDYELEELSQYDSSLLTARLDVMMEKGSKKDHSASQVFPIQHHSRPGQSIADGGMNGNRKGEKHTSPSLFTLYKLLQQLLQNDPDVVGPETSSVDNILSGLLSSAKSSTIDNSNDRNVNFSKGNALLVHALLPPRYKCTHRCTLICHPGPHQQCQSTITTTVCADEFHRETIQSIHCACHQPVSLFCVDIHQSTQSLLLELLSKYVHKQYYSANTGTIVKPFSIYHTEEDTTNYDITTNNSTKKLSQIIIPDHILQTIMRLPYLQSISNIKSKPAVTCGKLCHRPLRKDADVSPENISQIIHSLAYSLQEVPIPINPILNKHIALQHVIAKQGMVGLIKLHHAYPYYYTHFQTAMYNTDDIDTKMIISADTIISTQTRHHYIISILQHILTQSSSIAIDYKKRTNRYTTLHQQDFSPSTSSSTLTNSSSNLTNQHSQTVLNTTMLTLVQNLHDFYTLYQQVLVSFLGGINNTYFTSFLTWFYKNTHIISSHLGIANFTHLEQFITFLRYDFNTLYNSLVPCQHYCESQCHFGICPRCTQYIKPTETNSRNTTVPVSDFFSIPTTPLSSTITDISIDGLDTIDINDNASSQLASLDDAGDLNTDSDHDSQDDGCNDTGSDTDHDPPDENDENDEKGTERDQQSCYKFVCFCERHTTSLLTCDKASYRIIATPTDTNPFATSQTKELSYSCGSTCSHVLRCGHQCSYECHNNDTCPPCIWCTKESLGISPCSCTQSIVFAPNFIQPAYFNLVATLSPFFNKTTSLISTPHIILSKNPQDMQWIDIIIQKSDDTISKKLQDVLYTDISLLSKRHPSNMALKTLQIELSRASPIATTSASIYSPTPVVLAEFIHCAQQCNGLHLAHATNRSRHTYHHHTSNSSLQSSQNDDLKQNKQGIIDVIIQSTQYQCQHTCPKTCHSAACPPCLSSIERLCRCGRSNNDINCFLTNLSTFDQFITYYQQLATWYNELLYKCDRLHKTAPNNIEECISTMHDAYVSLTSVSEPGDMVFIHPIFMLKYKQLSEYLTLASSQLYLPSKATKSTTEQAVDVDGLTLHQHRLQSLISLSQLDNLPVIALDDKERKNLSIKLTNDEISTHNWPLFGQGWFITSSSRTFKRGDLSYALSTQQYIINSDQNVEFKIQDEQVANLNKEKQLEKLQAQRRLEMEKMMGLSTSSTNSTLNTNNNININSKNSPSNSDSVNTSINFLDLSQIDKKLQDQLSAMSQDTTQATNGTNDQVITFRTKIFLQPYTFKQPYSKFMFHYLLLPSLRYIESISSDGNGSNMAGLEKKQNQQVSLYSMMTGQASIPQEHLLLQLQPLCPRICKQQLTCQNPSHQCNTFCCTSTTHSCTQRCRKRLKCGHIHESSCHKGECGGCTHGMMNNPISCDCGLCLNTDVPRSSSSAVASAANKYGRITCSDQEYNRVSVKCKDITHQQKCLKGLIKSPHWLQFNVDDILLNNLATLYPSNNSTTTTTTTINTTVTNHQHDATSEKLIISLSSLINPNINVYHQMDIYNKVIEAHQTFITPLQPKVDRRRKKGQTAPELPVVAPQPIIPISSTSFSSIPKSPIDQSLGIDTNSITMLKFRYIHTLTFRDQDGSYINMLEYCESKQQEWAHLTESMSIIPTTSSSPPPLSLPSTSKRPHRASKHHSSSSTPITSLTSKCPKVPTNLIIPMSLFDHCWFPPGHTYSFTNTSYIEQYLPINQYRNIVRQSNAYQRQLRETRQVRDSTLPPGHSVRQRIDIDPNSQSSNVLYGPLRSQYSHLYYPTPNSQLGRNVKHYYQSQDSRDEMKQQLQQYFPYGICTGEDGLFLGQIEVIPSAQYVEHIVAELRRKYIETTLNEHNRSHRDELIHGQGGTEDQQHKFPKSMFLSNNFNIRPITLYDYYQSVKMTEEQRQRNEIKKIKSAWKSGMNHKTGKSTQTSTPKAPKIPSFLSHEHTKLLHHFNQYKLTLVCFPFSCDHDCGKDVCHPFACTPCYQSVIPSCTKHNNATQYLNCYNAQADYYTNGDIKIPLHCNQSCDSLLHCNQHYCDKSCHDGNCLMKLLHLAGTLQYVQNNYSAVAVNPNDQNILQNSSHAVSIAKSYKLFLSAYTALKHVEDCRQLVTRKQFQDMVAAHHQFHLPSIYTLFIQSIRSDEYTFPLKYLRSNPISSNASLNASQYLQLQSPTSISSTAVMNLFGSTEFELFTPTTPINDLTVIISQLRPLIAPSTHSISSSSITQDTPLSNKDKNRITTKRSLITASTQSQQQTNIIIAQQNHLYIYALRVIRELLLLSTINLYIPMNRFYYTPNASIIPYPTLFSTFYPQFSPSPSTSTTTSTHHSGDHNAVYTKQLTTPPLHFATSTMPSSFAFYHPHTTIPTMVIPLPELIDIVISLFEINTGTGTNANVMNINPIAAATILHLYLLIVIENYTQSTSLNNIITTSNTLAVTKSSTDNVVTNIEENEIGIDQIFFKAQSIPLYSTIINHTCSQRCGFTTHRLYQSNIYLTQTPPVNFFNNTSTKSTANNQLLQGYHPHQCVLKCHSNTIITKLFNSQHLMKYLALKSSLTNANTNLSTTIQPNLSHIPAWLMSSPQHIHLPMYKEGLFINYDCKLDQNIKETIDIEVNGAQTKYPSICVSVPIPYISPISTTPSTSAIFNTPLSEAFPETVHLVESDHDSSVDPVFIKINDNEELLQDLIDVHVAALNMSDMSDIPDTNVDSTIILKPIQPPGSIVEDITKIVQTVHVTTETTAPTTIVTKIQPISLTNKILLHYTSAEQLQILASLLHCLPAPQFPQSYHKKKVLLDLYQNNINCTCSYTDYIPTASENSCSNTDFQDIVLFGNPLAHVAPFDSPSTSYTLPTLCIHQYFKLSLILQQYTPTLTVKPHTIYTKHEKCLSSFINSQFLANNTTYDDFTLNSVLLNDKTLSRALLLTPLVPLDELLSSTNYGSCVGLNTTISLTLSLPLLFQNISHITTPSASNNHTYASNHHTATLASCLSTPTTHLFSTHTSLLPLSLSILHTLHNHYNPLYPDHKQYPVTEKSILSNVSHWPYYHFDHIHDNTLLPCQTYHPYLSQKLQADGSHIMNTIALFPWTHTPAMIMNHDSDSIAFDFNNIDNHDMNCETNYETLVDDTKKDMTNSELTYHPAVASITTCNIFPCQHGITTSCPCGNNKESNVQCHSSLYSSFMLLKYSLLLSLLTTTTSPSVITTGANTLAPNTPLSPATHTITTITRRVLVNSNESVHKIKLHPIIIPQLQTLLREELPAHNTQPASLSPFTQKPIYHSSQPTPEDLHQTHLLLSSQHFAHTTRLPRLIDICNTYSCQKQRKVSTIARILNVSRFDQQGLKSIQDYVGGVKSFIVDGFTVPLWNEHYGMYTGGKLTYPLQLTIRNDRNEQILQSYFTAYRGGSLLTIRNNDGADDGLDTHMAINSNGNTNVNGKMSQLDYMQQYFAGNNNPGGSGQLISKQSLGSDGIITPYPPTFIANLSRQYPEGYIQLCENMIINFLSDSTNHYPLHFTTPTPLSSKYRQCLYMVADLYHVSAKSFLVGQNPLEIAHSITSTNNDMLASSIHSSYLNTGGGTTSLTVEKQMILTRTPASSLPLYSLQSALNMYKQTNSFLCCTVDSFGGFIDNQHHLRKIALSMKNKNIELEQKDSLLDAYKQLKLKQKQDKVDRYYESMGQLPQSIASLILHDFVDNNNDDHDCNVISTDYNDESHIPTDQVTSQEQSNVHLTQSNYETTIPTYGSNNENNSSSVLTPNNNTDDWGPAVESQYIPESWDE